MKKLSMYRLQISYQDSFLYTNTSDVCFKLPLAVKISLRFTFKISMIVLKNCNAGRQKTTGNNTMNIILRSTEEAVRGGYYGPGT